MQSSCGVNKCRTFFPDHLDQHWLSRDYVVSVHLWPEREFTKKKTKTHASSPKL